jgi:hypothetical protein
MAPVIPFLDSFVNKEGEQMRSKILIRLLMALALLLLMFPIVASAQVYNRDRYARYDRADRRDIRDAIARLDNSSARLEGDLNVGRGRRVLGFLWVDNTDTRSVAEVRDFRRAVSQLRNASNNGRDLQSSYDEARVVLNRGVALDRYLRLRTGRADVDADLSDIRSNLHLIAEAYDLSIPY